MTRSQVIAWVLVGGFASIATLAGCQKIPADRYGLDRLRFEGVEALDGRALALCLASEERSTVSMDFGLARATECGVPPFDSRARRLRLFRWPWTPWPLFDQAVLDRDLDRIVRWYRARGYPDARVVQTRIEPEPARESDQVTEATDCERDDDDEGCRVRVTIVIDEGEPVRVQEIELLGIESVSSELAARLRGAIELEVDAPFDEALYERSKRALREVLAEESHAHAVVEAHAWIGEEEHRARVVFRVTPGPVCVFGRVEVVAPEGISTATIDDIARIAPGTRYSPRVLAEARRAIQASGAFSFVEVRPLLAGGAEAVDVRIEVRTVERGNLGLGGGIQAGRLDDPNEVAQGISVSQWDVHFIAKWEHRNFLGGLRHLVLEERPRLVFAAPFPWIDPDQPVAFGNLLTARFVQPAFLEARTFLDVGARWDYGPDPYQGFTRHQISGGLDVRRAFWDFRVQLSAGLHVDSYQVQGGRGSVTDDDLTDWYVMYWQQTAHLDLRDQPIKTRRGFFASLTLQEAGYGLAGDWEYVRITPDLRGYIPLGPGPVLALRGRIGRSFIGAAPDGSGPDSNLRLGPVTQRYRSGGSTSNRGFLPLWVGDGEDGGVTLWELMAELRLPVTHDLWMSVFADAGDVHRQPSFRFDHPQISVGAGLRYYTILGPIRIDFGFRLPRAQVYGADTRWNVYCEDPANPGGADVACTEEQLERRRGEIFGSHVAGAINITIGEPF